ncbi:flagellar protein FliT [Brevibacillus sp. SIMBA_040]|uniref:flagellar protein FliT n=1 Tax=unclassified Brevibacillus TaxID=2684853 RepID=UPI0039787DBE
MFEQLDKLIMQLLDKSVELRDIIVSYDVESEDDVDRWAILLDQRQELMDHIDILIQQGQTLTREHKHSFLTQILLIDEQVKPFLQKHMSSLQTKMAELQKKKTVSLQYSGYTTPEAYGTFFDKKK